MKTFLIKALAVCFSFGLLPALSVSQTADVQIIHNSADPVLDTVDVYVDGVLFRDDMAYLTATPFINIPVAAPVEIGIAAATSMSAADTLKSFTVSLTDGERYAMLLQGVTDPANFAPNPSGLITSLDLLVQSGYFLPSSQVQVFAVHGSTDSPVLNLNDRYNTVLFSGLEYGTVVPDLINADTYLVDLYDTVNHVILKSFEVDLSAYDDSVITLFISGFLEPGLNQGGPSLTLNAALSDSTVISFPSVKRAKFEILHNSADTSLFIADIYLNGNLYLDDFQFGNASGLNLENADTTWNVGIAYASSTSVSDTIRNFEILPENGNAYTAMLTGVIVPLNYAPNPDGISTDLTLVVKEQVREISLSPGTTDLYFMQGVTDLPAIDIVLRGITPIVFDAQYKDTTGYISLPSNTFLLDITSPGGGIIYKTFELDLSQNPSAAHVLYATGFFDPSQNNNGQPLSLRLAGSGISIALAEVSRARWQLVHNSSDPLLDTIDVYLDGSLFADDFLYRTGTAFYDLNGDVNIDMGIAPANSNSVNDTIKNFNLNLINGSTVASVLSGVFDPAQFASNPNGFSTALQLLNVDGLHEFSNSPNGFDVITVNGITDLDAIDFVSNSVIWYDDLNYANSSGYNTMSTTLTGMELTPANSSVPFAIFNGSLTSFGGLSGLLLSSGFGDPLANQNGPGPGLFLVFNDGTWYEFSNVTSVKETEDHEFSLYPNPANSNLNIIAAKSSINNRTVRLLNLTGQIIQEDLIPAGTSVYTADVSKLSSGMYYVEIREGNNRFLKKLIVGK